MVEKIDVIWRCKHVADALAERHVGELSLGQRIALRLHVALCIVCGRYHRQVMAMQDIADRLRQQESGAGADVPRLGEEARQRLLASVRAAGNDSSNAPKT